MPTAHTVLLIVAAMVAALTWVIPSGKYERLEYVAEKQIFIQHGKDLQTTYPATQATLDQLNVSLPVENFISGDVWKPIGIPGTYYELPNNPQGFFDLLQPLRVGVAGNQDTGDFLFYFFPHCLNCLLTRLPLAQPIIREDQIGDTPGNLSEDFIDGSSRHNSSSPAFKLVAHGD